MMKITDFERGLWFAIETLAHSYEEGAVRVLIQTSKFDQKKCLALCKESGFDSVKTMEVVDMEMKWNNTLVLEDSK